ncbi:MULTISPECIES: hypothetical protein [Paenibacillus]|nr:MULTISPECIES: hypothetical protein [Paenibacillus]MDH6427056.1 hypothetical protein [Paenibacillus sp. PastH-4]MDH6443085.1 hypothetical protein [Paenibacillus sp. PastF-4]MDH6526208.1 hypothetical protein [Paenibacillus sp. PastH-3]
MAEVNSSIYGGEDASALRTVLQLFGVFGVFFERIGLYSAYFRDFE